MLKTLARLYSNPQGISIVQGMIMAGILSATGLVTTKLIIEQKDAMKSAETRDQIEDLHQTIRTFLTDKNNCTETITANTSGSSTLIVLLGKSIDPYTLSAIHQAKSANVQVSDKTYEAGKTYLDHNITIRSITLQRPRSGDLNTRDLEISYERLNTEKRTKRGIGGRNFVKKIPIRMEKNQAGEVEACYAFTEEVNDTVNGTASTNASGVDLSREMCQQMVALASDPAFYWDESRGSCVPRMECNSGEVFVGIDTNGNRLCKKTNQWINFGELMGTTNGTCATGSNVRFKIDNSSKKVSVDCSGGTKNIKNFGTYRGWSDGTYARTCKEYFSPASPFQYSGDIGNGIYKIDPDINGPINPLDVSCDMNTGGRTTLNNAISTTPVGYTRNGTVISTDIVLTASNAAFNAIAALSTSHSYSYSYSFNAEKKTWACLSTSESFHGYKITYGGSCTNENDDNSCECWSQEILVYSFRPKTHPTNDINHCWGKDFYMDNQYNPNCTEDWFRNKCGTNQINWGNAYNETGTVPNPQEPLVPYPTWYTGIAPSASLFYFCNIEQTPNPGGPIFNLNSFCEEIKIEFLDLSNLVVVSISPNISSVATPTTGTASGAANNPIRKIRTTTTCSGSGTPTGNISIPSGQVTFIP